MTTASNLNESSTRKKHVEFKISTVIIYVILSLWAITTLYPFVWVISNAFKKNSAFSQNSFSLPLGDAFTFENFTNALDRFSIPTAYKNSLIITIAVTIMVILIAGFAAYALSRYKFKGKKFLQSLVVAAMMFPAFATIIPVYRMLFDWHLAGTDYQILTQISVILPQIAGNLSFAIIVLTGFIKGVPIDLEESAYLEGCNIFQIFFKIVVPVARPSFATVAIFTFLWSYNDLFTQMFFLRYKEDFTITRLLNEISSQAGIDYGLMTASVVMIIVPVLIVYICLQKNIIKGMTVGAVKG
ncbi:MAG: carbohydrate ABC transporter permease [Oscillospiraceae bacterium]